MAAAQTIFGSLIAELHRARKLTERLFAVLKPAAIYERPIAERHRVVFYLGHLDGFDSIQICREGLGLKSPDPDLDALFQAGIDPDSTHLPTDKSTDWPGLQEVEAYAARCRAHVDENIEYAPEDVIHMALEHREMHLETLAYMFHNFPYDLKALAPSSPSLEASHGSSSNEWIDIPTGAAILGKLHDGSFGWDNEYEEVRRTVPAFRIQRHKISNAEYLQFVNDGATPPHFWVKRGDTFFYRGMFEERTLPLDWPVYVTQKEAEAYAQWAGKSLMTEEQFDRAAYGTADGSERPYPWGNATPRHHHGNFDYKGWDPEPVYATPSGDSAFGVSQLVGNGWEWTRTVFDPLPGFVPRATYPGYSANFFDGEHYVMKGGSPRTDARLLRRSFRNWFRRDYPYMYATFRCVEE